MLQKAQTLTGIQASVSTSLPPALGPVGLSDRTRELSQFEGGEGKTIGYYAHVSVP